jgi:hypothetical protein
VVDADRGPHGRVSAADLVEGQRHGPRAAPYSGTAGRVDNSRVAVFLTYAAPRGLS